MDIDLDFVQHKSHRRLIRSICERQRQDPEVIGILLKGSVARGDAYSGSDLDLQVLLRDGCQRPFFSAVRDGTVLEISYSDVSHARTKLTQRPMWVYAYLDGRILYDPHGALARLVELAHEYYTKYSLPQEERRSLSYWLKSVQVKVAAAVDAGDLARAAYYASTSSWKVLEGIWAVHDKPIPPAGALWAHVDDLTARPPSVRTAMRVLFEGDAEARVQAALAILEWVLPLLDTG